MLAEVVFPGTLKAEDLLCKSIREGRTVIRYHRDQRGDDRCFLDDYIVWAQIPGSPTVFTRLPFFEDGMQLCRAYYHLRRAENADPIPARAITDSSKWDDDLLGCSVEELLAKLCVLQETIRVHRDIADRLRTVDDDRALYAVLPEKIPADFRLPKEKEFLGEACAPKAGCPAFWRSHADCLSAVHNFHQWGPCTGCQAQGR